MIIENFGDDLDFGVMILNTQGDDWGLRGDDFFFAISAAPMIAKKKNITPKTPISPCVFKISRQSTRYHQNFR